MCFPGPYYTCHCRTPFNRQPENELLDTQEQGASARSSPLSFYFITKDPGLASVADAAGVHRIMVDLEVRGKAERQKDRDTLISVHQPEDISRVRDAIQQAALVTRVNPLWEGTRREVDDAVARGSDRIMLPMFRTPSDLARFVDIVGGRVPITGLLETQSAMECVSDLIKVVGVDDFHIGLTDLHLELRMHFLFQCLAEGYIDKMAMAFREAGVPFGFGGIGRIGEGMLPAELIIAEHMRVGSSAIILGRVFHNNAETADDLEHHGLDFAAELDRIVGAARAALDRSPVEVDSDRQKVRSIVANITTTIEQRDRTNAVVPPQTLT